MDKAKFCDCAEPVLPPELPTSAYEYKGEGLCGRCGGKLVFPLKKKDAKSTGDPVVDYINDLNLHHGDNMTVEKAVIIMLLRIEKLLGGGKKDASKKSREKGLSQKSKRGKGR